MKPLQLLVTGALAAAIVAAGASSSHAATTLFTDLGPGQSYDCCTGYLFGTLPNGLAAATANSFVASAGGEVSEIDVALQQVVGGDHAVVSLWTSAGKALGTQLGAWTVSGFPLLGSTGVDDLSTIKGVSGISLTGGDTYYLQVMYQGVGLGGWPFNSQGVTGTALVNGAFPVTFPTGAFEVLGTAVPEPTTWAMLILGAGLVGAAARRRSARVAFGA